MIKKINFFCIITVCKNTKKMKKNFMCFGYHEFSTQYVSQTAHNKILSTKTAFIFGSCFVKKNNVLLIIYFDNLFLQPFLF